MPFEVAQEEFSGPLHVLLELIEGEKLPITDVALARIAEAYVAYVNEHDVPMDELADFLIVATKLLLLKSQAILPATESEEEEESTLAEQLRLYKIFVDASMGIEQRYTGSIHVFAREKPLALQQVAFAPPIGVRGETLHTCFLQLLKRLEPFFALTQQSLERAVSVQERMEEIRQAILERSRLTFSDIMRGAKSKVEVVVSFLALLELVKRRLIHIVQSDVFQDIIIRKLD